MGVAHSHLYVSMPKYAFKNKDVSAIHHKMAGKCVTQNMG